MAADPDCRCGHAYDDHVSHDDPNWEDELRACTECDCSDYYPAWFRDGLHRLLWGAEA